MAQRITQNQVDAAKTTLANADVQFKYWQNQYKTLIENRNKLKSERDSLRNANVVGSGDYQKWHKLNGDVAKIETTLYKGVNGEPSVYSTTLKRREVKNAAASEYNRLNGGFAAQSAADEAAKNKAAAVQKKETEAKAGVSSDLIEASDKSLRDIVADVDKPVTEGADTSGTAVRNPNSSRREAEATTVAKDQDDGADFRVRLSPVSKDEAVLNQIYGENHPDNLLTPLRATKGFMFPFTPQVAVSQDVSWDQHALTHNNYEILSYQRTPSASISLNGKFTVQNQREGRYALACIHFLRTMSKMYYGKGDQDTEQGPGRAGLPPPVLRLRGYGNYMFNDLRVVIKNFSFTFDETMDLVRVDIGEGPRAGFAMLPPLFSLSVSLAIQQTPQKLREKFSLDAFRTGELFTNPLNRGYF